MGFLDNIKTTFLGVFGQHKNDIFGFQKQHFIFCSNNMFKTMYSALKSPRLTWHFSSTQSSGCATPRAWPCSWPSPWASRDASGRSDSSWIIGVGGGCSLKTSCTLLVLLRLLPGPPTSKAENADLAVENGFTAKTEVISWKKNPTFVQALKSAAFKSMFFVETHLQIWNFLGSCFWLLYTCKTSKHVTKI